MRVVENVDKRISQSLFALFLTNLLIYFISVFFIRIFLNRVFFIIIIRRNVYVISNLLSNILFLYQHIFVLLKALGDISVYLFYKLNQSVFLIDKYIDRLHLVFYYHRTLYCFFPPIILF